MLLMPAIVPEVELAKIVVKPPQEIVEEKKEYEDIKFFDTEQEARDYVQSYGGMAMLDQVTGKRWVCVFVPKLDLK